MLTKYVHEGDVLLAYLPLAHVLEFLVENVCLFWGVTLGYGTVRTLTDASVRECQGDIKELRPTLMTGVPAVSASHSPVPGMGAPAWRDGPRGPSCPIDTGGGGDLPAVGTALTDIAEAG